MVDIINASDCEVRKVPDEGAKKYLSKHNGDSIKFTFAYGIYYIEELVQMMVFGPPRYNHGFEWEILKITRKDDYEVEGGIKKIWDQFLSDNNPISVLCRDFNNIESELINECGFKRKQSDSSEILSWFKGGVVYKLAAPNGEFYIGSTIKTNYKDYTGSGSEWNEFLRRNNYSKQDLEQLILKDDFDNESEMRRYERDLIAKFFEKDGKTKINKNCMNKMPTSGRLASPVCPECGSTHGHKKTCSRAEKCPHCGMTHGHHDKSCPNYIPPSVCEECGGIHGHHKSNCSQAKRCKECGGTLSKHLSTCSLYRKPEVCPECGCIPHRSDCSFVKRCPECGANNGHTRECSQYAKRKRCPECGLDNGHKKDCSRVKRCPYCGTTKRHSQDCPNYKPPIECPFCHSNGRHKDYCINLGIKKIKDKKQMLLDRGYNLIGSHGVVDVFKLDNEEYFVILNNKNLFPYYLDKDNNVDVRLTKNVDMEQLGFFIKSK